MDLMLICTTVLKMAHSYLSGQEVHFCSRMWSPDLFLCVPICAECFGWLSWPMTAMLPFAILFSTPVSWTGNFVDSWLPLHGFSGAFDGIVDVAATMSFSYCGSRKIAQFFCDVPALHLSCTDTSTFETLIFICCVVMLLSPPLSLIIISYTRVIITVIRMSSWGGSAQGFHHLYFTSYCCGDVLWSSYVHIYETHLIDPPTQDKTASLLHHSHSHAESPYIQPPEQRWPKHSVRY